MKKLELKSIDDLTLQNQLRKISYKGKDMDFITNPFTIALFRILISLYVIAEQFFLDMPFIRMYGTYTCKEIVKRLCCVVEKYARPAFYRKRKYADPMFKCLNFSKLILGAGISFGIGKNEERKFWENAAEIISYEYKDKTYEFNKLAIFKMIDLIERQLRIEGKYKKTFTRIPRGYVVAEGTLKYGDWKEMRKLGSILKKQMVILDLSNGVISWEDDFKDPATIVTMFKRSMKNIINPASLKYLYGEIKYEALADPKRNMTYLIFTNEKGRTIIFQYYQQWIKGHDIYFEVDIVPSSQYELTYGITGINAINEIARCGFYNKIVTDKEGGEKIKEITETEFTKFYKKPTIIRENVSVKTHISGITTKRIDVLPVVQRKPYIIENSKNEEFYRSKKHTESAIKKRIITPLCKDGSLPTVLAENKETYWYYTVSTGYHPNPGILEVRTIPSKKKENESLHPFQEWLNYSDLIERKYEGYNPKDTKDLDYFKGRKFSNQILPEIISTMTSLKENEQIVERSLMPKETFLFMGVKEEDADKICNSDISDDALYKLSGNSIVVDVLAEVFKALFIPKELHDCNNNGIITELAA